MKWLLTFLVILRSGLAFAGEDPITDVLIKECRIQAANAVVEIYPALDIRTIGIPMFLDVFKSKDELGQSILGRRYNGKINFVVGDIEGVQHYTCTFISYDEKEWMVSYAGLGRME